MRLAAAVLVLSIAACAGCGGDDDVSADARPADASPVDSGGCVGAVEYTGEVIDFDSTESAFLGVFGAQMLVRGTECFDETAPNGRFVIDTNDTGFVVNIDAPDTYVDGIAMIRPAQLAGPASLFSYRTFTAERATALYGTLGQTFDTNAAHVMINQVLDHESFALAGTHGAVVGTEDGATWAPADDARYLLFTNVPVAGGTADLTAGSIGTLAVPLEAGKLTFITTYFALE
jgi:hypothetical protein